MLIPLLTLGLRDNSRNHRWNITSDDANYEDYPSEEIMKRWHQRYRENKECDEE